ncbi:NAD(P)(+) transhydrogenase (Re/Si-specific) subunit beta [Sphingobium sp. Z007]|uniref:NAD(P)(+) transhydrogenase (Re/Si-specific) subunit beta n=1 Tax=Sphingobium sp. Z007 TaxID=627495 RepID=UPI000B49BCA1|nr:NAD(P)(+) transhydrogenase (Re/Si-specific) subunit beta [Sphingobium sp. Z007]
MIPPVGAAWLGAQLDGIDPSPVVAGAYLLSALLLFLGLWLRSGRHGNRWAMAGIATGAATAVYSHDVVNLPEMVSAVVIGGSIGLLLARRSAVAALPWLMVAGHGLLGVAAMAMAATLWRNPSAFGLTADDSALLAVGFGLGATTLAGALALGFGRWLGALPLLSSGAGWTAAALGFAIGNSVMVMAGGMAGVAGLRFAWRASRIASRALPPGAGLP